MAKTSRELLVTQSLVDRLRDLSLDETEKWPASRKESVEAYRNGIKRDIRWLLNTRQPIMPELRAFPEASRSMLSFGLPDVQSYGTGGGKDPSAVRLALLQAIQTHEKRLQRPHVELVRSDTLSRRMIFEIGGEIVYESIREDFTFDTVLELMAGEFRVD